MGAGRDIVLRKAYCLLLLSFLVAVSPAPRTTGAQSGAPEIRSINPEHAGAGTRVTIKGRNFSTERQDNIVLFADKQATVNKAKRKKLVVTVPEELTPGTFAVTVTVGAGSTVQVAFDLVRVQAKLEPPLKNLAAGGAQNVISTIAEVTFFGRDQAGNEVSVTGSISVNFSDWGDPS